MAIINLLYRIEIYGLKKKKESATSWAILIQYTGRNMKNVHLIKHTGISTGKMSAVLFGTHFPKLKGFFLINICSVEIPS